MVESGATAKLLRRRRIDFRWQQRFLALSKVYKKAGLPLPASTRCTVRQWSCHLSMVQHMICHGSCCCVCGQVLPGDLDDAVASFPRWVNSFNGNGGALLTQLALKYGPVRCHFETEWVRIANKGNRLGGSGKRDLVVQQLYQALVATVERLDGKQMVVWTLNCGRNVSHHSGWLPLLLRLGIIAKAPAHLARQPPGGPRSATVTPRSVQPRSRRLLPTSRRCGCRRSGKTRQPRLVRLGEGGYCYHIKAFSADVRRKLSSYVLVGEVMGTLAVPKTCDDWCRAVARFLHACRQHRLVAHGTNTYFAQWLARSYLLALMRSNGVKGLRSAGISQQQLRQLGPDQCEWIGRICARQSASKALRALGFANAPEVFSMNACLFNDPDLAHVPPSVIDKHVPRLRRSMAEYREANGIPPHPVVLLKEAGII